MNQKSQYYKENRGKTPQLQIQRLHIEIKDRETVKQDLIVYDMLRLLTLPTGMKQALRLPHICITTLTPGLRFTVCHNYLFELTKRCDYIYQRMIF